MRAFRFVLSSLVLVAMFTVSASVYGQGVTPHRVAQANRVAAGADFGPKTQLAGHVPVWVNAGTQTAQAVDLGGPMHVSLVLRRDTAVQAAFEQTLRDLQNPSSSLYHQWLSPQRVGQLYGPTASDLDAVTGWLKAQGLTVDSVSPSGLIVEVSGSVARFATAFQTSFGYFALGGTAHFSAIQEPSIPTALTPVINVISGLTELESQPQSHIEQGQGTKYAPLPAPGAVTPELTTSSQTTEYNYVTPNDFNLIYDIKSVLAGGNTGATIGSTPQHVAIIGRSRVAATDISVYATNTAIPSYNLNTIIPTTGTDPGTTNSGDQAEATLDVDRVIGTAYGVQADLLISKSSNTYDGIYIAAAYNVNTLQDPIMTISFGNCEYNAGAAGVNLYDTLFSSAAAEGISVFVSSADSGAATCDTAFTSAPSTQRLSINYICSSTYATCVGGTEFADAGQQATYWSANNSTGYQSVLSYIPEGAWNEPTTTNNSSGFQVAATGGGASVYVAKPSWQTVTGVPNDSARDVPDISFDAASHDGYYACLDYELTAPKSCATGYFFDFSGTSAAAPSMAGIAALINTKLGAAQGNMSPMLYNAFTAAPAAFHDVTVATSGVTNCSTATPSMCNNSTPGPTSLTGGLAGYAVTVGYDQATGLGSLDVANLLTALPIATTPSFKLSANPASLSLVSGATTGNTSTITVTSTNGFAGTVTFGNCSVVPASGTASGTCSLSPTSVVLAANGTATATVTIASAVGSSGSLQVKITASGTATGGTTLAAASTSVSVTLTGASVTLTPASAALNFTSGATTGNTDAILLTSTNGFAGAVTLGCAVTLTLGTPASYATCSVAPSPVTLTSGGTAMTVLSIGSITAHAAEGEKAGLNQRGVFGEKTGFAAFALLLCLVPFRRRRSFRPLVALLVLFGGLAMLSGCGGGGNIAPAKQSSAGIYIVTVTATGTTNGATVASTISPVTLSLSIN